MLRRSMMNRRPRRGRTSREFRRMLRRRQSQTSTVGTRRKLNNPEGYKIQNDRFRRWSMSTI